MNENTGDSLPPLSEVSIARIERDVFAAVEDEPRTTAPPQKAQRRPRRWLTGLGIAAALAVGIVISPALLNLGTSGTSESAAPGSAGSDAATSDRSADGGGDALLIEGSDSMQSADGSAAGAVAPDAGRDIITTSEIGLVVADVSDGAQAVADLAAESEGYVESSSIGAYQQTDTGMTVPIDQGTAWINIRIPAENLTDVVDALGEEGEIVHSSVSRQDVTSVTVDLEARIEAAQTSVDRLTELMSQSGSVGDLIAAETALTERQAQLESYQQELKSLEDQVAMSTVSVQLSERTTVADADPAGFADGLLAGWNGLVVSLNALVVAIGFLLPWLAIASLALLVIWLIRRRNHRRQDRTES